LQHWLSASQELFLPQCPTAGEPFGLTHLSQSHWCGHSHPWNHLPQKTFSSQPPFPTPDISWVFTPIHSPATRERRNRGHSCGTHAPASAGLNSPSLPGARHKPRPTATRGHEVYHFARPDVTSRRFETPLPDQNCTGQPPAPSQSTSLSLPPGRFPSEPQQDATKPFNKLQEKRHSHTPVHIHLHPPAMLSQDEIHACTDRPWHWDLSSPKGHGQKV